MQPNLAVDSNEEKLPNVIFHSTEYVEHSEAIGKAFHLAYQGTKGRAKLTQYFRDIQILNGGRLFAGANLVVEVIAAVLM